MEFTKLDRWVTATPRHAGVAAQQHPSDAWAPPIYVKHPDVATMRMNRAYKRLSTLARTTAAGFRQKHGYVTLLLLKLDTIAIVIRCQHWLMVIISSHHYFRCPTLDAVLRHPRHAAWAAAGAGVIPLLPNDHTQFMDVYVARDQKNRKAESICSCVMPIGQFAAFSLFNLLQTMTHLLATSTPRGMLQKVSPRLKFITRFCLMGLRKRWSISGQ